MTNATAALSLVVFSCLGCGTHEDVLATRSLAADVAVESDGPGEPAPTDDVSGLDEGELAVVGSPLQDWPFEIARWPLGTPLADFFSGRPGPQGVRVVVDGTDAEQLRALWRQLQAGDYGPQRSAVAVEDQQGSQFLIVIQGDE